ALRDAGQRISNLSFNPTEAVSTSANAATGPAVVSRAVTGNAAMDHQVAGPSRGGVLRFERIASTSAIADADASHALNITRVVFFCRHCGRGDHWTRHCANRQRYCTTCRRGQLQGNGYSSTVIPSSSPLL
ncbi:hypothetical protein AAVH_35485, partial [Aphelenchoides avenae]